MSDKCGTYAGLQTHKVRGTAPCEPCRKAGAAYVAEWRSRPEVGARDRLRRNAQRRALWKLAREYPDRYRQLVAEEITAGVDS